jgi:hypothetical protein
MDDAKTTAAFLASPVGGFVVAFLLWQLLKVPETTTLGTLELQGEHLGPWHDAKTAITAMTAICTGISWLILTCVWASGHE